MTTVGRCLPGTYGEPLDSIRMQDSLTTISAVRCFSGQPSISASGALSSSKHRKLLKRICTCSRQRSTGARLNDHGLSMMRLRGAEGLSCEWVQRLPHGDAKTDRPQCPLLRGTKSERSMLMARLFTLIFICFVYGVTTQYVATVGPGSKSIQVPAVERRLHINPPGANDN